MSYMQLRNVFNINTNKFCYIDINDEKALSIFFKHNVPVKILSTFRNDKYDYIVNICKVPKKYHIEFDKCMRELSNKLLITGHPDYEDFCMNIINGAKGEPVND